MKEKNILIDLPAGIIASVLIICKVYAATLNPEQYPQISHLMSRIFTGKYSGLLIYLLVGYLFFRFIFNKSDAPWRIIHIHCLGLLTYHFAFIYYKN